MENHTHYAVLIQMACDVPHLHHSDEKLGRGANVAFDSKENLEKLENLVKLVKLGNLVNFL